MLTQTRNRKKQLLETTGFLSTELSVKKVRDKRTREYIGMTITLEARSRRRNLDAAEALLAYDGELGPLGVAVTILPSADTQLPYISHPHVFEANHSAKQKARLMVFDTTRKAVEHYASFAELLEARPELSLPEPRDF